MFPDFDAPFCKEVYDEATSYERLYEPVDQRESDSPDEATMERLHDLAIEGSPKAVVELRKLIKSHPGCPTLKNYLGAAHKVRGEFKKARRVEEQLWREHPDYLFARLGKANNLLEDGRHEEARAILGDSLRLADTCPQTNAFHVSQWKSFYQSVGICYASAGRFEQAQAILNALNEEELAEAESAALQQAIMLARLKDLQKRARQDEAAEIRVRTQPIPRRPATKLPPELHHPEVEFLYHSGIDIPAELVGELLALPRETLVTDLRAVLRDAVDRGPEFYHHEARYHYAELCFPIHALFLLSELRAGEALDDTLAFLSIHPDLIEFWFGNRFVWQPLYGIIGERLADCAAWMKKPGTSWRGRLMIADAAAAVALHQPERRDEVVEWFRELLEFFRDCEPRDNILDTWLVSEMISDLIDLRATGLAGLITDLYARNYVSELMIGTLDDVLEDLAAAPPSEPPPNPPGMLESYQHLIDPPEPSKPSTPEPDDLISQDYHSLFSPAAPPSPGPGDLVGRNDPCPCGNGRKYKKCCLGK